MKKTVLFLVLFLLMLGFGLSERVLAQAPIPWEKVPNSVCSFGNNASPNSLVYVGGDGTLKGQLVSNDICASGAKGREVWGDPVGGLAKLCPAGSVVGDDRDAYADGLCCPSSNPLYVSAGGHGSRCCPKGTKAINSENGQLHCWSTLIGPAGESLGLSESTNDFESAGINPPDGSYFVAGEASYRCPAGGCIAENGVFPDPGNQPIGPFTEAEINANNLLCMVPGQDVGSGNVCFQQTIITQEEFDQISSSGGTAEYGCLAIKDATERAVCFDCLANNSAGAQYYVYSSIGCVDTRQNPFVTRLFQIGLGLIGGLAIIRIMWGEVLRQSGKPEKIEEGREMEVAAFIALAVVVTAIPLLRFIGINLLQILPISFLQ